jgi:UDP-N-acetyl-D-mannosaminuronic acid dehydrogenase
MEKEFDIAIVGGLGHVGLPLGISFANENLNVCLYDLDEKKIEKVKNGIMPFIEYESEPMLKNVLLKGKLSLTNDPTYLSKAHFIIMAIGTPIDEYLNPKMQEFISACRFLRTFLDPSQIFIVRSTIYPGTITHLHEMLMEKEGPWHVAYCPERIVQGYAIKEFKTLPQIVAGVDEISVTKSRELFSVLSPKIIEVSLKEAELVKLFSNAWRYLQFAVTNQFYMMAESFGASYDLVRNAMIEGYGRAATLPTAGFAAGPCLLKDTMQLAAFNNNGFLLGHAAMMINEGLPNFLVDSLRRKHHDTLKNKKVGILGMSFKADIDDPRDSLSYKLSKILKFHGACVLCSDEFINNKDFVTKEYILDCCDFIIIGVPHQAYHKLQIPSHIEVIDLWNITSSVRL